MRSNRISRWMFFEAGPGRAQAQAQGYGAGVMRVGAGARALLRGGIPGLLRGGIPGLPCGGIPGLAVLALAAASACSVLSPDDGAQHELDTNRERWEDAAVEHQQYTLQQTVMCFCPNAGDAHEVRVTGDSITAVTNLASGDSLPPEQWQLFRTVDELFDMVQRGIDEADSFDVTYHPIHGYPATISIDYLANAVDDEIAVRTELVP